MKDLNFEESFGLLPVHKMTISEVVRALRMKGRTIVQAIVAIHEWYNLSLEEAKGVVSSHPSYALAHANAEPLHDAAEEALKMQGLLGKVVYYRPSTGFGKIELEDGRMVGFLPGTYFPGYGPDEPRLGLRVQVILGEKDQVEAVQYIEMDQ